jgi:hypothetical protein
MKRFLALLTLSVVLSIAMSLLVATVVKVAPRFSRGEGEEPVAEA